jgi:hypothetical protein
MNAATGADADEAGDSEDDGGSMALGACPLDPHPRSPRPRPRRRGPHGSDRPSSPRRVRRPVVSARLRTTMTRVRGRGATAAAARSQRLRLR